MRLLCCGAPKARRYEHGWDAPDEAAVEQAEAMAKARHSQQQQRGRQQQGHGVGLAGNGNMHSPGPGAPFASPRASSPTSPEVAHRLSRLQNTISHVESVLHQAAGDRTSKGASVGPTAREVRGPGPLQPCSSDVNVDNTRRYAQQVREADADSDLSDPGEFEQYGNDDIESEPGMDMVPHGGAVSHGSSEHGAEEQEADVTVPQHHYGAPQRASGGWSGSGRPAAAVSAGLPPYGPAPVGLQGVLGSDSGAAGRTSVQGRGAGSRDGGWVGNGHVSASGNGRLDRHGSGASGVGLHEAAAQANPIYGARSTASPLASEAGVPSQPVSAQPSSGAAHSRSTCSPVPSHGPSASGASPAGSARTSHTGAAAAAPAAAAAGYASGGSARTLHTGAAAAAAATAAAAGYASTGSTPAAIRASASGVVVPRADEGEQVVAGPTTDDVRPSSRHHSHEVAGVLRPKTARDVELTAGTAGTAAASVTVARMLSGGAVSDPELPSTPPASGSAMPPAPASVGPLLAGADSMTAALSAPVSLSAAADAARADSGHQPQSLLTGTGDAGSGQPQNAAAAVPGAGLSHTYPRATSGSGAQGKPGSGGAAPGALSATAPRAGAPARSTPPGQASSSAASGNAGKAAAGGQAKGAGWNASSRVRASASAAAGGAAPASAGSGSNRSISPGPNTGSQGRSAQRHFARATSMDTHALSSAMRPTAASASAAAARTAGRSVSPGPPTTTPHGKSTASPNGKATASPNGKSSASMADKEREGHIPPVAAANVWSSSLRGGAGPTFNTSLHPSPAHLKVKVTTTAGGGAGKTASSAQHTTATVSVHTNGAAAPAASAGGSKAAGAVAGASGISAGTSTARVRSPRAATTPAPTSNGSSSERAPHGAGGKVVMAVASRTASTRVHPGTAGKAATPTVTAAAGGKAGAFAAAAAAAATPAADARSSPASGNDAMPAAHAPAARQSSGNGSVPMVREASGTLATAHPTPAVVSASPIMRKGSGTLSSVPLARQASGVVETPLRRLASSTLSASTQQASAPRASDGGSDQRSDQRRSGTASVVSGPIPSRHPSDAGSAPPAGTTSLAGSTSLCSSAAPAPGAAATTGAAPAAPAAAAAAAQAASAAAAQAAAAAPAAAPPAAAAVSADVCMDPTLTPCELPFAQWRLVRLLRPVPCDARAGTTLQETVEGEAEVFQCDQTLGAGSLAAVVYHADTRALQPRTWVFCADPLCLGSHPTSSDLPRWPAKIQLGWGVKITRSEYHALKELGLDVAAPQAPKHS